MHLFQKTMVLRLLVQSWAFPTGKGMDERSSCTRVCGYLCLCTTAHSTGWTEHCHDNGNNTHIQYTVYRSISVATPMPSGHGRWSKNLGCSIVDHIDVVLLNPWFKWLADHLLSCNIQRPLSSLLEHTSPWCRDILGWHQAGMWHGHVWASFGATGGGGKDVLAYAARMLSILRPFHGSTCTHQLKSQEIDRNAKEAQPKKKENPSSCNPTSLLIFGSAWEPQ